MRKLIKAIEEMKTNDKHHGFFQGFDHACDEIIELIKKIWKKK